MATRIPALRVTRGYFTAPGFFPRARWYNRLLGVAMIKLTRSRCGRESACYAIEIDEHLHRCLVYIDLNMVRAGVVNIPQSGRTTNLRGKKRKTVCNPGLLAIWWIISNRSYCISPCLTKRNCPRWTAETCAMRYFADCLRTGRNPLNNPPF
jgi:hypothetical protein